MAQIVIKAVLDATSANAGIEQLKQKINSIEQKTVVVNADTSGLNKVSDAAGKAEKSFSQTEKAATKTGDSIGKLAGKVALWAAATTMIYAPIKAFEEALKTLQAVDDQLVTIRKVTGATAEELAKIEEQAYKTASAYGVAADEYLSSVAEFTRAGYGSAAEGLGELAVKTQLVGDVTQDTANQFLLSVDAAYQYQGNIEKLSAVLDGANEIDNKYATSIQKIAEGLGTVAPIAAQAHVGIDELSAAIGTITAVTQRSGSEAARAFRALILNILGDTKTEIEEGVTWTTGEIAGLRDVIKQYATEAYEAAEATGSVINPMEAIGGLAKSMEEGVLTEQKLMEMVSDIGGKLRTSQLLALIQNWDMYQSMLTDFAGAAGSADKEVENALDSWTRKTEILKNQWVEFVQNFANTDMIKGGLDVLIGAVELLNTDMGTAIVTVTAFAIALKGLKAASDLLGKTGIATFVKDIIALKTGMTTVVQSQLAMAIATNGLKAAIGSLTATMLANPLFWAAAGGLAIFAIHEAVDAFTVSLEEQREATEEASQKLEEMTGAGSEYDTLISKAGELTAEEEKRLKVLEQEIEAQKELVRLAMEAEFETYNSQNKGEAGTWGYDENGNYVLLSHDVNTAQEDVEDLYKSWSKINGELEDGTISSEQFSEKLRDLSTDFKDTVEELRRYKEAGMELTVEQEALIAAYDRMMLAASEGSSSVGEFSTALEEQAQALNELEEGLQDAAAGIEEFNSKMEGGEKGDTFKSYADIYEGFYEKFQAGMIGSNEYRAAIEALLSPEILESLGYDYEAAGELLASDFYRGLFAAGGEDYGAAFANMLYEMADGSGELRDANGDLLASFQEVDGTLSMQVESFEDLADELGMQPELLYAIIDALNIFSGDLNYTDEQVLDFVRSAEGAFTELDGVIQSVDVGEFVRQLSEAGVADSEIFQIVEHLKELDGLELTNVPQSAEDMISAMKGAQDQTDSTTDSVEELDNTDASVKVDYSQVETAEEKVKNLRSWLSGLNSTYTAKVSIQTTASDRKAQGTSNAPGGPTLVNEEGAELIKEGDTAFIAGGGKPVVVDLERGATVYTAKETKEILGGTELGAAIPAFSNGISGIPLTGKGNSGTSGSSGKKTAGKSTSSSNASVSVGVDTESAREALDELLQDMEHEIFLWEKEGNMTDAIIQQYRKMQEKVHDLAEKFRKQGLSETSDEIQELQKLWWDYYDEIAQIQEDLWDELEEAVQKQLDQAKEARDNEIDAIDRQIEALRDASEEEDKLLTLEEKRKAVLEAEQNLLNAQNERTVRIYNAASNQWEWVANAGTVESAQEALDQAKKDLEEYNKELALESEIEALEERKDAINAAYEAFEAEWEKIQQSIEAPGRAISEILQDIAENGAPAMQAAVNNVAAMLSGLSNYQSAAVGTTTGGSFAGGGGVASRDYANDTTDYSALMLNSSSYDEFKYWQTQRNEKIEAQGIDLDKAGYRDNESLYNEWASSHTFDSGGVLRGLGGLKATEQDEAILPPELTAAMLSPTSDRTFRDRVLQLGYLYGQQDASALARLGMSTNSSTNVTNNGGPYYINGVEIGAREAESMSLAQLARQMQVLALHTAQ